MTEFIMLVAAIAVGYIIAGVIVMCVMCNKFVMKKLLQWSYKASIEALSEFEKVDFMDEEKIEA